MNQNTDQITLVTMRKGDLPAVLELINAEGWDYDITDVERILGLDPDDSLVAVAESTVVGGVTVACHTGRALLGHVVVKDGWRKKGIGKYMLEEVIRRLDAKRIEMIELYSVPDAVDFYKRHGFRKVGDLTIFVGRLNAPLSSAPSKAKVVGLGERDLQDVIRLDTMISGFKRDNIIEKLLVENLEHCVGLTDEGELIGFALGRLSGNSAEIGPWIMKNPERNDAITLFAAVMKKIGNRKTYIEVPAENRLAHEIVLGSGFVPQYPVQRFVRSKSEVAQLGPGVMSYAALEYG